MSAEGGRERQGTVPPLPRPIWVLVGVLGGLIGPSDNGLDVPVGVLDR